MEDLDEDFSDPTNDFLHPDHEVLGDIDIGDKMDRWDDMPKSKDQKPESALDDVTKALDSEATDGKKETKLTKGQYTSDFSSEEDNKDSNKSSSTPVFTSQSN